MGVMGWRWALGVVGVLRRWDKFGHSLQRTQDAAGGGLWERSGQMTPSKVYLSFWWWNLQSRTCRGLGTCMGCDRDDRACHSTKHIDLYMCMSMCINIYAYLCIYVYKQILN